MSYTVGQLADLAGVTVRTLHHYDRIGLLVPEERSGDGSYRRYGAGQAERLHRILSYRELGMSLKQIAALLDDPAADRLAHLRHQERMLRERIARLEEMAAAVHLMMEAEQMTIDLTPEERFEIFGDFDAPAHAAEAEVRWGGTTEHAESRRRTASYGAREWREMRAEARAIEGEFAAALAAGEPAEGERAAALAARHREHITRWFYDCTPELHRGLGELYVTDPRFRRHYEDVAPGLADYVSRAIAAAPDNA